MVKQAEINKVQDIIKELEDVRDKRSRNEALYDQALETLEGLGCDTLEEAEKRMKLLKKKREKKETELQEEFDDFKEDYAEVFDD